MPRPHVSFALPQRSLLLLPLLPLLLPTPSSSSRLCVGFAPPVPTRDRGRPALKRPPSGLPPAARLHRRTRAFAAADDDDRDDETGGEDGPGWIRAAMTVDESIGVGALGEDDPPDASPPCSKPESLDEGLVGFAVDPDLGFVAVVADSSVVGGREEEVGDRQKRKWVYSVVAGRDTDRLTSAEALTLAQLAGGIDVGAAVLPPDELARILRDEAEEFGDEGGEDPTNARATKLVKCEVVPRKKSSRAEKTIRVATVESSTEREAKIASDAPRLRDAVQRLPDLADATLESVRNAMLVRANVDGGVGREAFDNILGDLRLGKSSGGASGLLAVADFALSVEVSGGSGGEGVRVVTVRAPSAFHAVGLSMRYSCPITISDDCYAEDDGQTEEISPLGGVGIDELLERFPAFRPMVEFRNDVGDVDGMLAGMFFKESAPKVFE